MIAWCQSWHFCNHWERLVYKISLRLCYCKKLNKKAHCTYQANSCFITLPWKSGITDKTIAWCQSWHFLILRWKADYLNTCTTSTLTFDKWKSICPVTSGLNPSNKNSQIGKFFWYIQKICNAPLFKEARKII